MAETNLKCPKCNGWLADFGMGFRCVACFYVISTIRHA